MIPQVEIKQENDRYSIYNRGTLAGNAADFAEAMKKAQAINAEPWQPEPHIMKWIHNRNKGKAGMYPYHEANAAAQHFKIETGEAMLHVREYIRQESGKVKP